MKYHSRIFETKWISHTWALQWGLSYDRINNSRSRLIQKTSDSITDSFLIILLLNAIDSSSSKRILSPLPSPYRHSLLLPLRKLFKTCRRLLPVLAPINAIFVALLCCFVIWSYGSSQVLNYRSYLLVVVECMHTVCSYIYLLLQ